MNKLWVGAGLAAIVCAPAFVGVAHAAQPYEARVRESSLPNGLKVLLLEDHKAPVATFQVWYRVGSRNEQLGKTGLAHMLEHLMFKGTPTHGPEEYSKIIQRNGGNENAFTSDDNTTYFATLASDRVAVAIELEADRMQNLQFEPQLFAPEQQVVIEERRLRTDNNPIAALFEQLNAVAYTAHPYQWPTIGWMTDLKQMTVEDCLAFYRAYYTPANAFVVVAGDFSADTLQAKIADAFGSVPSGPQPPPVRAEEQPQQGERRVLVRREAQLPFVALAYHVPVGRDSDGAALDVLSTILAGGKSSRLHQELVYRKRIARDAGSGFDMTSIDPGLFLVYGQPMPGRKPDEVERELRTQIEALKSTPVTDHELAKAKNSTEASFVFGQDSIFYQAMVLGQYEIAGGWRLIDTYLPRVRAVRPEDLMRVAKAYLGDTNRTVATLDPLPVAPGHAAPPASMPQGMVH